MDAPADSSGTPSVHFLPQPPSSPTISRRTATSVLQRRAPHLFPRRPRPPTFRIADEDTPIGSASGESGSNGSRTSPMSVDSARFAEARRLSGRFQETKDAIQNAQDANNTRFQKLEATIENMRATQEAQNNNAPNRLQQLETSMKPYRLVSLKSLQGSDLISNTRRVVVRRGRVAVRRRGGAVLVV